MNPCDFCRGAGYIPVYDGNEKQLGTKYESCPYCKGGRTNAWRASATAQRHANEDAKHRLVFWSAILIWPATLIFARGPLMCLIGFLAGMFLLGWALANGARRRRPSGIGSSTAPLAIGGLAFFSLLRYRHHHRPGDPLRIKPPWQG